MDSFNSFKKFQEWLKNTWFPNNPNAVQLDGSTTAQSNRKIVCTFDLNEVPNLEGRVSLHGDTTVAALEKILKSEINDFLIVPPQRGEKFVNWRFHHKSIHGFDNDTSADGMFAYVK